MVEVLKVVNDRAIIQFTKVQGRREAGVAHDKVRRDAGRFQRLKHGVGMPRLILDGATAEVRRSCGATFGLIANAVDPRHVAAGLLRYE